ncbi:MAG: hypothetical protein B6D35_09755 [Candidatus Brocadia sp. UTAMX2]|jgi:hypothetical protein|nr:MAG: hypothetical protein B6D35_09755 [Candidatus Brocadia sp. UTAMX2]
MEYSKTNEPALQDNRDVHKIMELLTPLSVRIDSLERSLSTIDAFIKKLPAMLAITTDIADEFYRNAAASGIDIEERLKKSASLLVQLTDPKKIDALSHFMNTLDTMTPLLKQFEKVPDILAMIVDSLDELCKGTERSGIDFERIMRQGKDAVAQLNELIKSDGLKALMNSGILNPKSVNIVAQAGCVLAECKEDRPKKMGIVGLIKAFGNGDIQCALGFLINFCKRFGRLLKDKEL